MEFDPLAYLENDCWRSSRLGLARMDELLDKLGNPQHRLKYVHVAGTNGKGSTCAYLASILRACGLRTGLFTSPYLERFEERIQVDGECISLDDLREVTQKVRVVADTMADHPTEFELVTAVAFEYFARRDCDIVVLEVGLGGRHDATNIIQRAEVCVIAPISLDHTDILGSTVGAIAAEKAAIVKPGAQVVSAPQEPAAAEEIRRAALRCGDSLSCLHEDTLQVLPLVKELDAAGKTVLRRSFRYRGKNYETGLLALYQPANAALAIEAAFALRRQGWNVPQEAVAQGVAGAQWPGRFELLAAEPLVIVDGGHNPQGMEALAATLADVVPGVRPVMVVGLLADKDYPSMLEKLAPAGSAFVCVAPDNPRALDANALRDELLRTRGVARGSTVEAAASFEEAAERALALARSEGVVCCCGSLYSIGDVKRAFRAALGDGKGDNPCTN